MIVAIQRHCRDFGPGILGWFGRDTFLDLLDALVILRDDLV